MGVAGYSMKKNVKLISTMPDVVLSNIDALADGEIIIGPLCMQIAPMPICVEYPEEGIIIFGVEYQ